MFSVGVCIMTFMAITMVMAFMFIVHCNVYDGDDDDHYNNISSQSPHQPTLTPLVCVLPF